MDTLDLLLPLPILWTVMPIDKSWINFADGLTRLLDFAFEHKFIEGCEGRKIVCPCSKCGWKKWLERDAVRKHLTCRPFPENYIVWNWHGEGSHGVEFQVSGSTQVAQDTSQPQNPIENMINDAFGFVGQNLNDIGASSDSNEGNKETHDEDNAELYELLKDNNQELYEGAQSIQSCNF